MCIGGKKDIHAYVGTFMRSAYVNTLKSSQAFFCYSRMPVQIRHPRNDVLALFIVHWLMLFKDTSQSQCFNAEDALNSSTSDADFLIQAGAGCSDEC